ncbi:MAG TPA: DMT family transporter [Bacteroidales bacterium]|nr:DMT family transporter [Bacteroidales bacterium]
MNQLLRPQKFTYGLLALAGVVLFSAKSVFAKMIYAYNVHPVAMLYLRMMVALPFLLAFYFWYENKYPQKKAHWRDILQVIGISLIGYYLSGILDFIGLLYVEAAIERLILFLYPTMVLVLSILFLRKEAKLNQFIAMIVSYIGLLVAFADKLTMSNTSMFWFGVVLIVLSSFLYAIFLTLADKLIDRLGSIRFTTIACLTMTASIVIHAFITGKAHFVGYPSQVYLYSFIMGVFSTVVPVFMFNYAIEKLGSTNVSIISCAGPICTLMYSALLIDEPITLYQIVGTLIVMAGIMFVYKSKTAPVEVRSSDYRRKEND